MAVNIDLCFLFTNSHFPGSSPGPANAAVNLRFDLEYLYSHTYFVKTCRT